MSDENYPIQACFAEKETANEILEGANPNGKLYSDLNCRDLFGRDTEKLIIIKAGDLEKIVDRAGLMMRF